MTDLAVLMSIYHKDKLPFVQKSIRSILDQTFRGFHYFIAFDGNVSDEVEEFITSINDERITVHRIEKHQGLANALNFLLRIVMQNIEYKYIARMDADDISVETRFEIQRKFLSENPEIACVGSWYKEIDVNGKDLSFQRLPTKHEEIIKFFYRRSPLAHPSVMFIRDLIQIAGYYPTNTLRLEDYVFWSNAINKGFKLANIPEYLISFRTDKDFYRRRSGIVFGYNYILTRFRINYNIKAPFYVYFYSVLTGLIRMMPEVIIRMIYRVYRSDFFQKIKNKQREL